ncbi:MAG: nucleoside kinase [Ezakiella sp.]|nr:nucleoside kinase [Ezakiella sp.]MDD7471808.1 nucleoside kinase [Bacillota bacterium]MDY3923772.1 nucleoside kinase [Ezakiella sp.]
MKIKIRLPKDDFCYEVVFQDGEKLIDIISRTFYNYREYLGAVVNAELVSLNYVPKDNEDIKLLDILNSLGLRIYTTSLTMIFETAIKELYGDLNPMVEHYIGSNIYVEKDTGNPFTMREIEAIKQKMHDIINEDYDFKLEKWDKDKALNYFKNMNRESTVSLLKYVHDEQLKMYKLINFYDRFDEVIVPSTGFISRFDVEYYYPGILIKFPSKNKNNKIDYETEESKLAKAFQDHAKEAKIIGVNYVGELNEKIENGGARDLVLVSESFIEQKIREIAMIVAKDKAKRLILISGPSSSGKTTFAYKLKIALKMYGLETIEMSTDDYFVDRKHNPKNPDGTYNFETIDAVDIEALNQDILKLIESGEAEKRSFDFIEGKPVYTGEKRELGANGIIILEGIHGLNPVLSNKIPNRNKIKIYLSALSTMNIDSVNRLSTTDVRFLRRMVRDQRTRGRDVLKSLAEWGSVRKGEDIYVFPYQEQADIIINTSLFYEISILKKFAMPLLKQVPSTDKNFVRATRLLKMLDYFTAIDDENLIPNTSIIREFIGGSIFE